VILSIEQLVETSLQLLQSPSLLLQHIHSLNSLASSGLSGGMRLCMQSIQTQGASIPLPLQGHFDQHTAQMPRPGWPLLPCCLQLCTLACSSSSSSKYGSSSSIPCICAEAHGGCPMCPAGAEFEARILASEANNVKFNFLQPTDPYHAYYRMRVSF
jgi:hypothetical protein